MAVSLSVGNKNYTGADDDRNSEGYLAKLGQADRPERFAGAFMVFAPVGFFVLPLVLIARNPHDDFSGRAQLFVWTAPLSCAFWMLVSCHWQTVRQWQRMGRLNTWRQDHGGLLHTVTKATVYMFGGLFGSFFFEILFLIAFRFLLFEWFDGVSRFALWFALFPFSAFAPVILLWLVRWWRGRTDHLLGPRSPPC